MLFPRAPIKRLVVVADDDATRAVGMVTPFDIVKVMGTAAARTNAAPVQALPTAVATP